ncbi:signal peptidase I [Photobacterium sanguinicancri]|uniref:signal peptidase I n=1 Tax=Photobacterium sanguinicancri TaxID=875932 RepID=UPI003D0C35B2
MGTFWKPNILVVIVLGLIVQPFVFLYVNKPRYFVLYFLLLIGVMIFSPDFIGAFILICPIHGYIIARRYKGQGVRPWFARWWVTILCFLVMLSLLITIRVFFFDLFRVPANSMSPFLNPGDKLVVDKRGFGNYRYFGMQFSKIPASVNLERGDVIVFQYPKNTSIDFVKRIVALPGDKITYINKKIQIEKYCRKTSCSGDGNSDYLNIVRNDKGKLLDKDLWLYEEYAGNNKYDILIDKTKKDRTSKYFTQENSKVGEWIVPLGHYFVLGDYRDKSLDSRYWGFVPQGNIIGTVAIAW